MDRRSEMDELRSYLVQSDVDIWHLIHSAIHLAACDYPLEFRDRRVEIAETLFSRSLYDANNAHNDNANNNHHRRNHRHVNPNRTLEEGEVRDGEEAEDAYDGSGLDQIDHIAADDGVDEHEHEHGDSDGNGEECDGKRKAYGYHDETELDEETVVLREIESIKESIKDVDQPEKVILDSLQRLQYMQITVEALKSTEIGKHVNGLRKHASRKVRGIVKELVKHWKTLVDEWVNSAQGDTRTECGEFIQSHDAGDQCRLPSSLVDDNTMMEEGRASTGVDLSQLFSFIEGGEGSQSHSHSQSGSIQIPEERGSATRRDPPITVQSTLKGKTSKLDNSNVSSIVGNDRVSKGVSSTAIAVGSKSIHDSGRKTLVAPQPHVNSTQKSSALKTEKCLVDQKLENAKRKLHQGYQQAENAKKQRVVQVLDIPDIPKTASQAIRIKPNPQSGQKSMAVHGGQNRKYRS